MQTTKQKRQTKQNFERLAEELLPWLTKALDYLDQSYWDFRVSRKGKYMPAIQLIEEVPRDFCLRTEEPRGEICFRVPVKQIRTTQELANAREQLFKTVSVALIASIGVSKTNRLLKDLREAHGLKQVSPKASWASRRSDDNG